MNYFFLLSLTPAFNLDLPALEAAYIAAQRRYHPDRFVGKPPAERQQAMQVSADINQAYRTLKEPLPRAQYLLHLQGIEVGGERDGVKPSPALLTEAMEWRERVDEAASAEALTTLENSLNAQVAQSITLIGGAYIEKNWDTMAQETLRLGYLLKTREAINNTKFSASRRLFADDKR